MKHEELVRSLECLLEADKPILLVLAGSNGAGKSTFYDLYLSRLGLVFINADHIAQRLDPDDPTRVSYEAAQVADVIRRDLAAARQSFCMETVFSDPAGNKVQFLREAQAAGYVVVLLFIRLSDPTLSTARVIQRVARGGHDVPDEKLAARFERTRRNVASALQFVDLGFVIDNSSAHHPYQLVEQWEQGTLIE